MVRWMEQTVQARLRPWLLWGAAVAATATAASTWMQRGIASPLLAAILVWFMLVAVVFLTSSRLVQSISVAVLAVATVLILVQPVTPVAIMLFGVFVLSVVLVLPLWVAVALTFGASAVRAVLAPSPPMLELSPDAPATWFWVPSVAVFGFAVMIERATGERLRAEALAERVVAQNAELRGYNERIEALAARQERSRMALELHDRLGHALMTAHVYVRVLEQDRVAAEQRTEAAASADRAIQRATDELRQCVGLLAEQDRDGNLAGAIRDLVAELTHSPVVEFSAHGEPRRMDPRKELALFRVAQEGLTNAARHSNATRVDVRLKFEADAVELSIADDGQGCEDLEEGLGFGGMRLRLAGVGGALSADPSAPSGGFVLTAVVPTSVEP